MGAFCSIKTNGPSILEEAWRATSASRMCNHHFEVTDYIIPPSVNGSCRLKKYAIPSKSHVPATFYATIPSDTRCRLDWSNNKRPISPSDLENLSRPEKKLPKLHLQKKKEMSYKQNLDKKNKKFTTAITKVVIDGHYGGILIRASPQLACIWRVK